MKAVVRSVAVLALGLLVAGCATGPKTAVGSRALKGDYVIYFEQADRVPKDVLLAANKEQKPIIAAMAALPAEVIGTVIKEFLAVIPNVTENYNEERMVNALIGRRMLFVGYHEPEQLIEINNIVNSMGSSIEYLTPQTSPGPGMRAAPVRSSSGKPKYGPFKDAAVKSTAVAPTKSAVK